MFMGRKSTYTLFERVGDDAPGVVAVLCECVHSSRSGWLGSNVSKRLVVYEATQVETATNQKGLCRVLEHVDEGDQMLSDPQIVKEERVPKITARSIRYQPRDSLCHLK